MHPSEDRRELFKSKKDGQWYFHFRRECGTILGVSEEYHNRQDALARIFVIKEQSPTATVD